MPLPTLKSSFLSPLQLFALLPLILASASIAKAATPPNVASGGIVRASHPGHGDSKPASVVDGAWNVTGFGATSWFISGAHANIGEWIEIDLKQAHQVEAVTVHSGLLNNRDSRGLPLEMAGDFVIQTWTGAGWDYAPGGAVTDNRESRRDVRFEKPIITSKVRLVVRDDMSLRIREIEVSGRKTDQPLPGGPGLVSAKLAVPPSTGATVNGKAVFFRSGEPVFDSPHGHPLAPAREVIDAMGGSSNWDSAAAELRVHWGASVIELRQGEEIARIDGKPVLLDHPLEVLDGLPYLSTVHIETLLGGWVTNKSSGPRTIAIAGRLAPTEVLLTTPAPDIDHIDPLFSYQTSAPDASRYVLRVDGRDHPVYVTDPAHFARFDLRSPVEVEIECMQDVRSAVVRPLARGVQPRIEGRKVRFTLQSAAKLSVEINGDLAVPLFVFADAPSVHEPAPDAQNVIRLRAGMIYDVGQKTLKRDNLAIHLEAGSVLRGRLTVADSKNVRLTGRGLIDGRGSAGALRVINSSDITLSGPVIVNSGNWTSGFYMSRDISISDIKSISWNRFSDGIDTIGANNLLIEDAFIYSQDDGISLKLEKWSYAGDTRNVVIRDCVFWNGIPGRAIIVGPEAGGPDRRWTLENVRVSNVDIIRSETDRAPDGSFRKDVGRAAMAIHHLGAGVWRDIVFENVRIEESWCHWLHIENTHPEGRLENIRIGDVALLGGPEATALIRATSPESITDLVLENTSVRGRLVPDLATALANGFTIENATPRWR